MTQFQKGNIPWSKGKKIGSFSKERIEKARQGVIRYYETHDHFLKGKKNPKGSETKKRLYREGKIKKLVGKNHPNWKGGAKLYVPRIRVKKPKQNKLALQYVKTTFKKGAVPWNKGIKNPYPLSLEARQKISQKLSGNKSHLWRGGITKEVRLIRTSLEYRAWRKSVFERDDYTCVECGSRNGDGRAHTLNADHIKPFSLYPELRFDLNNGRTLCTECHLKTETYGNRLLRQQNCDL